VASKTKILIVGGGIYGLSTAWALNKRGYSVEVFEQGPIPNPKASSYDETRITRHAYGELDGYAQLMPAAFRQWDEMWSYLGVRHFDALPLVILQRRSTPWMDASLDGLDRLGIGYRHLELDEVSQRFPMVARQDLTAAAETDGAGVLFPTRIMTDLLLKLAADGVTFHANCKVDDIDPEAGTIRANGKEYRGDKVVVCAGAWADRIVPQIRGVAVPSRQAILFVAPPAELTQAWHNAPIFIDFSRDGGTYTLPPRPGTRLKVGDHEFTRTGNADGDRLATDEDIARLTVAAGYAYRDFDRYTVLERKACYYTVTEDERFLAQSIGAKGVVLSACSGHGFKLAPLMAEGVAKAIAGETSMADLPDWAAGRSPSP
jgi:glycine/D-amino acid oxidase-like deaminating enzyme